MGASLSSGPGSHTSGGSRRGGRYRPMAEINVTPFVDVMMVLLVIFIVTAPLLIPGVAVNLPKTDANALPGEDEALTVSITQEGVIYLQETEIALEELQPKLLAISEGNLNGQIYLRADGETPHNDVMQVMSRINRAGFTRIGLVTDPVDTQ